MENKTLEISDVVDAPAAAEDVSCENEVSSVSFDAACNQDASEDAEDKKNSETVQDSNETVLDQHISVAKPVAKKELKQMSIPTVDVNQVISGRLSDTGLIDNAVRQNSIESDRAYRQITEDIIQRTGEQLTAHTDAKKPLRKTLLWFVIILLIGQFLALVAILFLNQRWSLKISDYVINVYIVSLFVETLAGLIIMIRFSFDSTQEVELIKVLNSIILHFKKYDDK